VQTIFNLEALLASLGWYGLSLVLYAIIPATEVQGTVLSGGGRLKYKFNSKSAFNLFW
jgi:Delta14-sterol reductase